MKLYIVSFFTITFCITDSLHAQTSASLDTNNVSSFIRNDGMLFLNGGTQQGNYYVPKNGSVSSFYSGSLWVGGLDENKQLHVAGQLYRMSNKADFYSGPVASNYTLSAYATKYNRVWKITKQQIDNHKINYNQGGYQMPSVIASWPGNGNAGNGEASQLALYKDVNNNGVYDPQNGDYPIIRGDEAVFSIFNDDSAHTESTGQRMKIEVHCMAYSFNLPNDSALKNTTFINYTLYNRSTHDYDSLYLGNFMDFDIGSYNDDYIGCDSALNMYYAYNGFANDGLYGAHPPAQGALFLNANLSTFFFFGNVDDPTNAPAYYNYMKAIWPDGTHMTFGGNGYGGTNKAHYMYCSDSTTTRPPWKEEALGNQPGDRRGVGAIGPFKFLKNNSLCVDIALVFARDYNNGLSVKKLKQLTPQVQQFYTAQNFQCPSLKTGIESLTTMLGNETLTIYPNPFNQITTLNYKLPVSIRTAFLRVYDIKGCMIYSHSLNSQENSLNISANDFENGVYLYGIEGENYTTAKKKMVVVK